MLFVVNLFLKVLKFLIIMKKKTFKMIVIGDSGVGKTALVRQFSRKSFTSGYQMTIGIEFESKDMMVKNEKI